MGTSSQVPDYDDRMEYALYPRAVQRQQENDACMYKNG